MRRSFGLPRRRRVRDPTIDKPSSVIAGARPGSEASRSRHPHPDDPLFGLLFGVPSCPCLFTIKSVIVSETGPVLTLGGAVIHRAPKAGKVEVERRGKP